jgi:hypothetical protein
LDNPINKQILETNAIQLGLLRSVDFLAYDVAMDEGDRRGYVASIASVIDILRRELKEMEIAQLKHVAETAENWDRVLIARGTINACAVLLERWESMVAEHNVNITPEEEFNKHDPLAR